MMWELYRRGHYREFVHPDYVSLPDAFEAVGRACFPEWTGEEMAAEDLRLAMIVPSLDRIRDGVDWTQHAHEVWYWLDIPASEQPTRGPTAEQWEEAHSLYFAFGLDFDQLVERKGAAIAFVQKAAVKGCIEFHSRLLGGAMEALPAETWNLDADRVARIFAQCCMPIARQPIFISRVSLADFLDRQSRKVSNHTGNRIVQKKDSEAWYLLRVEMAKAEGRRHSRRDDEEAGIPLGISRDRIRELRAKFAPDWSRRGRPPKRDG